MIINTVTYGKQQVYGMKIPYSDVSANIEYMDSAYGMTESERQALLRSWARHAIVKDGVIQYWLNPNDLTLKEDGTASDLTGTDGDVMLLYRPIYWKVSHVDDSYTIIQFADYDFDKGHTVTAHQYGDKVCAYLGLGVFEGIIDSSQLRSICVNSNPTVNTTNDAFYNAAVNGRTALTGAHYNQLLPLTWTLQCIFLLFEKGDRNVQNAYGRGVVNKASGSGYAGNTINEGFDTSSPWNKNNSSGTSGVTACGIHNFWGNTWTFFGEFEKETSNIARFTVKGGYDHCLIDAGTYPSTWASVQMTGAHNGYVMDIIGDNNLPFLPRTKGGSDTTYWADYCYNSTSQRNCGLVGGRWDNAREAGPFYVLSIAAVGYSGLDVGARLQVLIE